MYVCMYIYDSLRSLVHGKLRLSLFVCSRRTSICSRSSAIRAERRLKEKPARNHARLHFKVFVKHVPGGAGGPLEFLRGICYRIPLRTSKLHKVLI